MAHDRIGRMMETHVYGAWMAAQMHIDFPEFLLRLAEITVAIELRDDLSRRLNREPYAVQPPLKGRAAPCNGL